MTDALKWRDPWYRELSKDAKIVYGYLVDNCDPAGVWQPDFRLAQFCIKSDIDWEEIQVELGDRVRILPGGEWFMTRFIPFQYGPELRTECAPHRSVLGLLEKHGITLAEVYRPHGKDAAPAPKKDATPLIPGLLEQKPSRSRDLFFEALVEIQKTDLKRLTPSARAKFNKAASEIRKVEPDATADRVRLAARNWTRKYTSPVTALALASHWSELTPAPAGPEQARERQAQEFVIRQAQQQIDSMMDNSKAQPMPRDDLTDAQLKDLRKLKEFVAIKTEQLKKAS